MPYTPTHDRAALIAPDQNSIPGPAVLVVASPSPPPAFPTSFAEAVQVMHSIAMEPPEKVLVAASLCDAIAVLHSSLHHTPLDCLGVLSQASASLQCKAVDLIADQEVFESLVHQHKMAFLEDPKHWACIQWASVCWMLDQLTKHDPLVFPGDGQSWEVVLLALIQRCLGHIAIMEEDTLHVAAEAWGFFLVIDSDLVFHCKQPCTEAPTGSKCKCSGS